MIKEQYNSTHKKSAEALVNTLNMVILKASSLSQKKEKETVMEQIISHNTDNNRSATIVNRDGDLQKNYESFLGIPIQFKSQQMVYNSIFLEFKILANKLSDKFKEIYQKENRDIDDVSRKAYSQGSNLIAEAISKAIRILVNNFEVYDLDEESFIEEYYLNYHTWDEDFGEINDRYMEIILKDEELDHYRKARRNNRGRVIGGGFGLAGAAKGMVTAGAVNMAFGAAHAAFNGVGKVFTMIGNSVKKAKLFDDPNTLGTLSDGISRAVFNVHFALIDAINERSEYYIERTSSGDVKKAESMLNNIKRNLIDRDNIPKLLSEIVMLYPHYNAVYKYAIEVFGDPLGDVEKTARIFGISISEFKESLLETLLNSIETDTEENTKELLTLLEKEAKRLSIVNLSEYTRPLEVKLHHFDNMARTVDNVIYDTRDQASLALADYNKIKQILKNGDLSTEASTQKVFEEIKKTVFNTSAAVPYIKQVQDALDKFDEEFRTVNGKIYATRDEASIALNEYEDIKNIREKVDFQSQQSINEAIQKIEKRNYITDVADSFINEAHTKLEELELASRTFNEVVYESVEMATKAKQETEIIERIIDEANATTGAEIQELILKLNQLDYNRDIIKENVGFLEYTLEKLDESERTFKGNIYKTQEDVELVKISDKIQKAKKFENRKNKSFIKRALKHSLFILISFILLGVTSGVAILAIIPFYIIYFLRRRGQKKAWKIISEKGRLPIPEIPKPIKKD